MKFTLKLIKNKANNSLTTNIPRRQFKQIKGKAPRKMQFNGEVDFLD
jgi:hypothetical protein